MTPEDVVLAFAEHLTTCVQAMHRQFSQVSRFAADQPLMLIPREGGRGVRVGHLEGLGQFELHGVGCRVELSNGEIIDFDWDGEGREIFDGWRLGLFAWSFGNDDVTEADLVAAARSLEGIYEPTPGWFALDGRKDRPTRKPVTNDRKRGVSLRAIWEM